MLRFAIALMLLLQQAQQNPETPPQPDPQQMQKVEDAHRGLFQPKSNAAKKPAVTPTRWPVPYPSAATHSRRSNGKT